MAITLYDYIDGQMKGGLQDLLEGWHIEEGLGTPTMAKRLNDMGYPVEQRTVWRWLRDRGINRLDQD